ncbi:hypothetical protein J6590_064766, partial [Homalodisca vitripennis]
WNISIDVKRRYAWCRVSCRLLEYCNRDLSRELIKTVQRKAQVPIKSKGLGLWLPALRGSKHTLSPAISKAVIP